MLNYPSIHSFDSARKHCGSVNLSKASFKHRVRNFLFGLTASLVGLLGSYLVFRSRLTIRLGISEIPPGIGLYLPGAVILILGGILVMAGSLKPMKRGLRFCLICASNTNHFRADPRFKDGKKIGDSYVCDACGQKYLIPNASGFSADGENGDGTYMINME